MQKMLPILGHGRSLPVVRDLERATSRDFRNQPAMQGLGFIYCSVFDSPLNPKVQDP